MPWPRLILQWRLDVDGRRHTFGWIRSLVLHVAVAAVALAPIRIRTQPTPAADPVPVRPRHLYNSPILYNIY